MKDSSDKIHKPSPHNDTDALKNAIEYLAPLCTAIKFDAEQIKSTSRKIQVLIQRALLCYRLRVQNQLSLYRVRDVMGLKAHATVINLIHFYEGKSNRPYRQYYLHMINLVFSQSGNMQDELAKDVNEKFLEELANLKLKPPPKQRGRKKKVNSVLQGGETGAENRITEPSADCLPLPPTPPTNANQSETSNTTIEQ